MKLKIDSGLLKTQISTITSLISEATLTATPDEVSIIQMDPANVAMIIFKIHSSSFVLYEVKEETKVGINLNNLKQMLKRAKAEDLVGLELIDNLMHVSIGTRRKFTLPTIEMEDKPQKIPELNFKAKLEMPTKAFRELIDDIAIVAESMALEGADNKLVTARGEGDLSKAEVKIEPQTGDKDAVTIDIKEKSKSKYSIEYLNKMVGTVADTVVIHWSNDYPMKLVYVSDKFSLSYILAPRVDND